MLGELIRKSRRARGLTQTALEDWAGVDQTVISRLETGRPIGVRLTTLLRLFDALGIQRLEPAFRPWHPWSEGRDEVVPPDP